MTRRDVDSLSRRELLSLARRLSRGGRVPDDREALAAYVARRLDPEDDPPAEAFSENAVSWDDVEALSRVRPRRRNHR